jgi:hypothetical protein
MATAPSKRGRKPSVKAPVMATAPSKRGRKPSVKAPVIATAPKGKRGRPALAKATAPVMATAPKGKRGRPALAKVTAPVIAPKKRRGGKKASTSAKAMKPSAKAPVKATSKGRGRRATAKA